MSEARLINPRGLLRRAESWIIGGIAISVVVFFLAAAWAGGGMVMTHIASLSGVTLLGLLGLSLANYFLRSLRWIVFSERLGLHLPWPLASLYFFAGFSMTLTPGKLGEGVRLWLLYRGHDFRLHRTASLLIGDRLSDACAVLLLTLVGLAGFPGYGIAAGLAAGAVLLLTLALLRPRLLIASLTKFYGRLGPRRRRFARRFARLRMALRRVGRLAAPRIFGTMLVIGILGWFCESLAFHWVLVSFGATVSILQAVFIFTFSMLVGILILLPGGLGGTEATMIGLLVAIGVDFDSAIAATAVTRVTTLWFAVALGLLALPISLRIVDRQAALRPVNARARALGA